MVKGSMDMAPISIFKGFWSSVATAMIQYYDIKENASILYIGCGKGFILYEFKKFLPKEGLVGIDISGYAVENAKDEIKVVFSWEQQPHCHSKTISSIMHTH